MLAPFAGTITSKIADTGDLASPGKALVKIEDSSALRLEIPVAESLADGLTEGQQIQVRIDAANFTAECPVTELAPSGDPGSRTFLVKIDLPKSSTIKSGSFGRAWIAHGESKLLLVPASSVVMRGQMEVIFIKSGDVAKLRLVRTVPHSEGYAGHHGQRVVLSGISEGAQVIVNPDASLRDGSPLTSQ